MQKISAIESLAYITDLFVDTHDILDDNLAVREVTIEARILKDN